MPVFTSSLEVTADYPTIEPSLRLDFANARALDPRITFTRESVATYVGSNGLIKTVNNDEPRFDHDPTTGESLGLLIEESRTNDILNSDFLITSNWVTGFSGNTSEVTGLSGAFDTATLFEVTGSGGSAGRITANGQGTFKIQSIVSVFVKLVDDPTGESTIFLRNSTAGSHARFTIATETVGTAGDQWSDPGFQKLSDGWYRFFATWVKPSDGTSPRLWIGDGININTTEPGTSMYVRGFQSEEGSFPTSYIPTSGSTVTRQMETMSLSGSNFSSWNNQSEGTYIMTIKNNSTDITGLPSPARTQSIFLFFAPDAAGNYTKNLTSNVQMSQLPVNTTDYRKWAFYHHGANGYGMCINGNTPTESNQPIGTSDTSITFNDSQGQTSFYLKSLFYYPKRLTNTQLQTLTQ